jgi:hypothetical protein
MLKASFSDNHVAYVDKTCCIVDERTRIEYFANRYVVELELSGKVTSRRRPTIEPHMQRIVNQSSNRWPRHQLRRS